SDWLAFAHRTFKEEGARLVPDYDPALATVLAGVSPERPLPPLWREFDALAYTPVMVVRGTNSDILSAATVQAMRERRRSRGGGEVAEGGPAPRLSDAATASRIAAFVASCDGGS